MHISQKYLARLENYKKWIPTSDLKFLRPIFEFNKNALDATTIMWMWESKGIKLLKETRQPELLADYVQGKQNRDFHIAQWKEGIEDGLFQPWEFFGALGCNTIEEFESVFKCYKKY